MTQNKGKAQGWRSLEKVKLQEEVEKSKEEEDGKISFVLKTLLLFFFFLNKLSLIKF